ncbi:helix-turn-helix domain-containing protein [Nocardia sp. NBC_01388]|uniref:helix-turn-helix domain-containing protein n=1 Tax=Nocardia sp. NBC_01388 TaxID=2903596 RepID=UPI00325043A5
MLTTGGTIRRMRKAIGMTQAELGTLIHFTQPAVSQLEHDGPAVYDVRVLRRVARALQVPLATLLTEPDDGADMNRRQFFKTGAAGTAFLSGRRGNSDVAVSRGTQVGRADIERITKSVNQIHELQLIVGGDRLCDVAANEVYYVEQLLDLGSYTDTVGRSLTASAAGVMTAAGWVHYDAGRWNDARRYYADAAQAATASGDSIAAAHAWINACLLSFREGSRPKEGVQLAEAAQLAARRAGGPKLRALAAIREAEAHSVIGDRAATVAAVNRAHRAFDSTGGQDPDYLVNMSEAQLSGLTGLTFMSLGEHRGAATYIRAAIDGAAAYPRERTAWQIRLAQNSIQAAEIADGCDILSNHFEAMTKVASARLRAALSGIVDELRLYSSVPEAENFLGMWIAR